MKKRIAVMFVGSLFSLTAVGGVQSTARSESPEAKTVETETSQSLKLENLLTATLEGVEGTEVIVSRVTIPPNMSLPKHWHPGEEFAYILEGSVVLWQEGKPDSIGKKGDVMKVPLKQIHTARTEDEGATILVFRVHEQGKPERINVD